SRDDPGAATDAVVALQYSGLGAPRVVAKGEEHVAADIIALAKKHGIPIHEDPALVGLLSQVEVGEEIPETLYRAIAEVLAFAYWVSERAPPPRLD
ncbi:MAG: flagellar biosynthesis protein, partial [Gammaproteobacteria bacterium]